MRKAFQVIPCGLPCASRYISCLLSAVFLSAWLIGCRSSVPAPPDLDPEAGLFEQGMTLQRQGKPYLAQAAFEQALRLNPAYAPAVLALLDADRAAGRYEEAAQRLVSLQRLAPQTPHLACQLAEVKVASGHFVQALPFVREAVAKEPSCPLARAQIALELDQAGQEMQAIAAMQTAHALAPQEPRYTLALAQMLALAGQAQPAGHLIESLPAQSADSPTANFLRGWLLSHYGRTPAQTDVLALQYLNRVLQQSSEDGPANLEKCRVLLRQNKAPEASACLQKAKYAVPPSIELFQTQADVCARLKLPTARRMQLASRDFQRFLAALHKARQRYMADATNRDNCYTLARLEAEGGNLVDAQALLTAILQRDPNDAQALKLLTPDAPR